MDVKHQLKSGKGICLCGWESPIYRGDTIFAIDEKLHNKIIEDFILHSTGEINHGCTNQENSDCPRKDK